MVLLDTRPVASTPQRRRVRSSNSDAHMIRERCDAAYNDTVSLRNRQMSDYELYRLTPFTWRQIAAEKIPRDTAAMTANEPRTLADTIASILMQAPVTYRVPTSDEPSEIQDAGRAAEELFHGLLTMAEDERPLMVQPPIKQQLVFYMLIRGFAVGMHTLTKNDLGETVPNIEIWDPLNVYWGVSSDGGNTGQNHHGLAWICHYQDLDTWRLDSRFGKGRDAISGGITPTYMRRDKPMYRVYDYYDREFNTVVIDDKVVDKQRHYGMGYVPATIIPVGPSPLIIDSQAATSYPEEFGAGIYSHNRALYPILNAIYSTKFERVLRYVNPSVALKSRSGRFALPANVSNPFSRGQRFQLSTINQEEIAVLEEPALKRDAAEFEGALQVQIQKGGVPNVAHGQNETASSGYNTALLLSSQQHVLEPRAQALGDWFKGAERHMRRQFASGYFESMKLSGEIDRRRPYNRLIEPAVIAMSPAPIFKCRVKNSSELPQRMSLAQLLKGLGLADDHFLLDEIFEFEDPDGMLERINLQNAKRATPMALLHEAIRTAEEQGETELAQILEIALYQHMQPGAQPQSVQGGGQPQSQLPPGSTPSPGPNQSSGGGAAPGAPTNAGGSPRSGQPNPSDESQLMGRPRPEGVR